MSPKPAPALNIPASTTTVKISAIDSTTWIDADSAPGMWNPRIEGFNKLLCGTWSFLIEHPSGRKLLYDLGCRKDWENLPPTLNLKHLVETGAVNVLRADKHVDELLVENGVVLQDIEGIVWSHWHFDHTGDPSRYPQSTRLIVGKGFKDVFLPGWPSDPYGHVLESDFAGRMIEEIDFDSSDVTVGRFRAHDYFGDGSFYILDAPGHAIGHVNALARTHASPDADFVHLGGDSIHHAGELRPTEYMPLPDSISPSPIPDIHPQACPGHFFTPVLRGGSKEEPILEFQDPAGTTGDAKKFSFVADEVVMKETVRKDTELDANENIFTIAAHDWTVKGTIDEWPKHSLNDWKEKGWKESTRWKFLKDFQYGCT